MSGRHAGSPDPVRFLGGRVFEQHWERDWTAARAGRPTCARGPHLRRSSRRSARATVLEARTPRALRPSPVIQCRWCRIGYRGVFSRITAMPLLNVRHVVGIAALHEWENRMRSVRTRGMRPSRAGEMPDLSGGRSRWCSSRRSCHCVPPVDIAFGGHHGDSLRTARSNL